MRSTLFLVHVVFILSVCQEKKLRFGFLQEVIWKLSSNFTKKKSLKSCVVWFHEKKIRFFFSPPNRLVFKCRVHVVSVVVAGYVNLFRYRAKSFQFIKVVCSENITKVSTVCSTNYKRLERVLLLYTFLDYNIQVYYTQIMSILFVFSVFPWLVLIFYLGFLWWDV